MRMASVDIMGLQLDAVTEVETIDHVVNGIVARTGGWLCTVNLDVLRQWRRSRVVRDLVAGADLVVADGMPLIWASALQGTPLPERVAGSTMTVTLTRAAAEAGASVFLLGGNPGTAEAAAGRLRELYPNLRVAGTHCPPFGFEQEPDWADRIGAILRSATPDLVYVGLGFPKQERVIAMVRPMLPHAWFMSCGISFSFLAGEVQRAPRVFQRLGLEWLHRLAQEPRRLSRRYLLEDLPFLLELLFSALRARRG